MHNARRVQNNFPTAMFNKELHLFHLYRHCLFIVIVWFGLFSDSFSAAKLGRSNDRITGECSSLCSRNN